MVAKEGCSPPGMVEELELEWYEARLSALKKRVQARGVKRKTISG
jgi:hypothetical protein